MKLYPIYSLMNMTTIFAVNKNGNEIVCNSPLYRDYNSWTILTKEDKKIWCYEENGDPDDCIVILPRGTIKKLIGRDLTWEDEPVILEDKI